MTTRQEGPSTVTTATSLSARAIEAPECAVDFDGGEDASGLALEETASGGCVVASDNRAPS